MISTAFACAAQGHLSERVYVSTDRDVYVSGDELFLSAFCIDMATGRLSGYSRTAYIEIASASGPVQTAKLALENGRGGGVIHLLNTIPTGNYQLVAYTAQCFNEDGYDFGENARTLSIINPFTTDRSESGVEILSEEDYESLQAPERPSAGSLRVSASGGRLTVTNASDKPVSARHRVPFRSHSGHFPRRGHPWRFVHREAGDGLRRRGHPRQGAGCHRGGDGASQRIDRILFGAREVFGFLFGSDWRRRRRYVLYP